MWNRVTTLEVPPAVEENPGVLSKGAAGLWKALHERLSGRPEQSRPSCKSVKRGPEPDVPRILVATDFSSCSGEAVGSAIAIAHRLKASVTFLHVIDVNTQPGSGESGVAWELMDGRWRTGSARMAQLVSSLPKWVEAETRLEEGLPWEQIVESSRDFDLLILGKPTSKRGWRLFPRNTAKRVVENAACPVIVL